MAQSNKTLHRASKKKNDEFYTRYSDIEKELSNYISQFRGQVYCNCDNPYESNFCKFFIINFRKYKLKRLICTSYNKLQDKRLEHGYVLDINEHSFIKNNKQLEITKENVQDFIKSNTTILNGDGSFKSDECKHYLSECDIVVTNPPFSLFREYLDLMEQYNKKFLIIGNMNALMYKDVFPLLVENKIRVGYTHGSKYFKVPDVFNVPKGEKDFRTDEHGNKYRKICNTIWITNLDIINKNDFIKLTVKYNPDRHPKFDGQDAIFISKLSEIPCDYDGVMGVPVSIFTKLNPKQFKVIGEAKHGKDNKYDLFRPIVNGKEKFERVLIQKT